MKVSVMQDNFAKAVATVSRVVGSRTSLPILANVLIQAEGSKLSISATNLEIALTAVINCKVEQPGAVSVPARLLLEITQGLQSEKIQLTSEDTQLELAAAGAQATLQGMPADEFPVIPEVSSGQKIMLSTQVLNDTLTKVAIAASLDESRPVLAGVFIRAQGDKLTFAATDSYRLAEATVQDAKLKDFSLILPLRTVQEVLRLIGQAHETEVGFEFGTSEARITVGETTLVTRLIEGSFPNYAQIIPDKSASTIRCARSELTQAVRLASVFARESAHTITLDAGKDRIKLHAEAAQVGENTSEVTAKLTGGGGIISLNSRFLLDVLGVITSDEVELKLNDKLDPCLVVPVGDDGHYLHLIMPLRS